MGTSGTRRSRTTVAGVLTSLVLLSTLSLAACGSEEPSLAGSPLPAPTVSGVIAFENLSGQRAGNSGDVCVVGADVTALKVLAQSDNWSDHPSWSPDGSRIAWANSNGEAAGETLWVMDADGSGKRPLGADLHGISPVWSADGRQIAFLRFSGRVTEIWAVNADGTGPRQVTHVTKNPDLAPTWTSDGRILFVRNSAVFSVDPDGSNLRQVTRGYNIGDFGLSPDSRTLAIYDYTNDRIVTIPVDGGEPAVTLLDRPSRYRPSGLVGSWAPSWSPDGKALVLATASWGADRGSHLYVVNADGTGLSAIPGVEEAMDAAWRPE